MSNQVTCLLLELAGLELQVESSRWTSAGQGYAGRGKWGVYTAVETCVQHRLGLPRPLLQELHLGGRAAMWRKESLISVHCNTSFLHSNSMFRQQLLRLTAMGGKALALWYFTCKGCLGSGAESYSLTLHAVLKEIRPGTGPILYRKRLSAGSCTWLTRTPGNARGLRKKSGWKAAWRKRTWGCWSSAG